MMRYPKIQTLYNRDAEGDYGVIPDQVRCPEFGLVKRWLFTEKVDGRNHRIILHSEGQVEHRGRTDKAQFSKAQMDAALGIVTEDRLRAQFDPGLEVILYGELYGPGVQKGGKYRGDIGFALFDVRVADWWLNWSTICEIASDLGLKTVPYLGQREYYLPTCQAELLDIFWNGGDSVISENKGVIPEGIVARTDPLLLMRNGDRLMWKLKLKDFK